MRSGSQEIKEFLLGRSAGRLSHPGGTLYEHLVRVAALLAGWGADQGLQAVGLCHACYGTVSFRDRFTGCAHTPLEQHVRAFHREDRGLRGL